MIAPPHAADGAVLDRWWRDVLATGGLPAEAQRVQGRLVRTVGRAELPSGSVFVKVMAFPRVGDRMRYLLRPMPARHEATMLARVAAAGVPCPEVAAVRTARRAGMPHRSMLVTRALPVGGERPDAPPALAPERELAEQAALAARLLAAGLWHPDLNPGNFVRLADGRLAVLDLQSMRGCRRGSPRAGLRMGARLLLEATGVPAGTAAALLAEHGLAGRGAAPAAVRLARAARSLGLRFLRSRVRRCLLTSTGFERRLGWHFVEHRRRGELPAGRWITGGTELLASWIGQRLLQLFERRPPILHAIRRNWLWLPGKHSAYIATPVVDGERDALQDLVEGYARYRWVWQGTAAVDLDAVRRARTGCLQEGGG